MYIRVFLFVAFGMFSALMHMQPHDSPSPMTHLIKTSWIIPFPPFQIQCIYNVSWGSLISSFPAQPTWLLPLRFMLWHAHVSNQETHL